MGEIAIPPERQGGPDRLTLRDLVWVSEVQQLNDHRGMALVVTFRPRLTAIAMGGGASEAWAYFVRTIMEMLHHG